MTDILERGAAWLKDQRVRHLSRQVTYTRGEDAVELAAAVGKTAFEIEDGAGAAITYESRDYIVGAADLVLGGEKVLPHRGDRIRDTVGGAVQVYEVMAPGREQHYRLSGPDQNILRIHTKLVDREEA